MADVMLHEATIEDRAIARNLVPYYIYDMSTHTLKEYDPKTHKVREDLTQEEIQHAMKLFRGQDG